MKENIITLQNLVKIYPTFKQGSVKDLFINKKIHTSQLSNRIKFHRKKAIDGVSFEIPRQSKFGILGHNGSGKSTLLSLMLGTLKPDSGRIDVNGRALGLLEMGSGFHPELSGIENVILYLSILGIRIRDAHQLLPKIIEFCELEDAMPYPLKTFSAGMVTRLSFSVLCHVPTDILLIDEVFAVGDYAFQLKCVDFMEEFSKKGGTIVYVSQDPGSLESFCDIGLCLHEGKVKSIGSIQHIKNIYIQEMEKMKSETEIAEKLS